VPHMSHAPSRLGDLEIATVCEGWAPLPLSDECLGRAVDWSVERAAYPWAVAGDGHWRWHVHAFLLRTPAGDVLVDSGVGAFGPYVPWAEQAGPDAWAVIDTAAVRHVVLTHLHADHAGGTVSADGAPRFPNARYHAHPADWEHFASKPVVLDDDRRYDARAALDALAAEGTLSLEPADHEVSPGVRAIHTPGHTPGHRSVVLTSGQDALLLTGDLLHAPIQAAHPGWPSSHDVDPEAGSTYARCSWNGRGIWTGESPSPTSRDRSAASPRTAGWAMPKADPHRARWSRLGVEERGGVATAVTRASHPLS
jgi:glyoxylase-like metal-dependent hydrolase (beta-lactamase superfamily II)